MIVSFKYDFLRKDEVVPQKNPEIKYTTSFSSNDSKFHNKDLWKFSGNIGTIKNEEFKPVEKWHADAIEKSIKAVDDELTKATNEVLEAKNTLEKAQAKVSNLMKQHSKLKNALSALK